MHPPVLLTESILPGQGLRWTFRVPEDLPFFGGHFPGHPILPGVVALGWMIAAAERFLDRPVVAAELLNVKFQVVVLPGALLELSVVPKGNGRLQGTIRSGAGIHASVLIPGQEASIRLVHPASAPTPDFFP